MPRSLSASCRLDLFLCTAIHSFVSLETTESGRFVTHGTSLCFLYVVNVLVRLLKSSASKSVYCACVYTTDLSADTRQVGGQVQRHCAEYPGFVACLSRT
jgi:hypothetical protein